MKNKSLAYTILFSIWVAVSIYFVSPFFLSIVIGIIFASIIFPLYKKSVRFIKSDKSRAALFSVIFTFFFLTPFVFIGVKSTTAALTTFSEMQGVNWANPDKDISHIILGHPVAKKIAQYSSFSTKQVDLIVENGVSYSRTFLTTITSSILAAVPGFIMSFIVIIGTIYFCLHDGPKILNYMSDNPFFSKEDTEYFFEAFGDVSYSVVLATIFCAAIQAGIFIIPTLIFDMNQVAFIAIITFICSFIPNIGTAPVSFYLVGKSILQNDWTAFTVYLVFAIIVSLSDNVLGAMFVGKRIHVHPFIAFIAAIGGIITLGVYGLFIAPVIILTLFKFYEYWTIKQKLIETIQAQIQSGGNNE